MEIEIESKHLTTQIDYKPITIGKCINNGTD